MNSQMYQEDSEANEASAIPIKKTTVHREKNGSNQSFDFIKDFKSSVKSLCD